MFAPDTHLGAYIQSQTSADMLLWDGVCVVHEAFKADALKRVKHLHPDAAVLVHPESPAAVIALADVVGSTTRLIQAVKELPNTKFIVATDNGIFHKMKQVAGDKQLIEAPTAGVGATCESCAHCPWMTMNNLRQLQSTLKINVPEIHVNEAVRLSAVASLDKMLSFHV